MIIDSSILVAIMLGERDASVLTRMIDRADDCYMSAGSYLETSMVLSARRGDSAMYELDHYIREAEINIVPFTEDQAQFARRAFQKYGKGRHKAGLNFGDCFAYALAKETGEPLLFKGDDFAQTDIEKVEY